MEEGEEHILVVAIGCLVEVAGTLDWAWGLEETKNMLAPSTLPTIVDVEHTVGDAEVVNFSSCATIVEVGKCYSRAKIMVVLGMIVCP